MTAPSRMWIALVSFLVPAHRRRDWREEWQGEVSARGADSSTSWGALVDAWYLRTEGWSVDAIVRDVRLAVRGLVRKPLFTALAGLTLAVGIGANTAIYSVVDGVLLDPLPFPEPERLVAYNLTAPGVGIDMVPLSEATFLFFQQEARAIERLAVVGVENVNLTTEGEPRQLRAARVSHEFFDVTRTVPLVGRVFVRGEDRSGAEPVAILGEGLWRGTFGADPGVVGRVVEFDGVDRRIVGVVDDGLAFWESDVALFVPEEIDDVDPSLGNFNFLGLARLAPGATVASAAAELERLLLRLWEAHPDEIPPETVAQARFGSNVVGAKDLLVQDVRQALWVILGTVGFVLLIACGNVANLFLVRAEGRQREQALRAALGAERADLTRQYLAESLTLSAAAGLVGLVLAGFGVDLLLGLAPVDLPGALAVDVDGSVLAFTLAVTLASGVLFGLFPLLGHRRADLVSALKEGGRSATSGGRRHRLRSALVVGQVALAMMLLVGSGLMVRSFHALSRVDLGFDPDGTLTFEVALPSRAYPAQAEVLGFHRSLVDALEALPGVSGAATVNGLPLTDSKNAGNLTAENSALPEGDLGPIVERRLATPDYFDVMGIELVEGRTFAWDDGTDDGMAAVILTEGLARTYWPDGSALGRRVTRDDGIWLTVVGVVGDVRFEAVDEEPGPMAYFPVAYDPSNARTVHAVVRTAGDPTALGTGVREALRSVDERLPIVRARPVEAVVSDALAATSFTVILLAIAAGIALLLGSVGIYGVISYVVSGRTQEIGVRMALGAPAASVQRDVVGQGMALTGLGLALGLVGSLALGRVLTSLLYGVPATDVATYVATSAVLGGVAFLAAWLPARRAARVDPVEALRAE